MQIQQRLTPEAYLALEDQSSFRSEYRDGTIVPMAGGSINHNRIVRNICTVLTDALRGTYFEPFTSDLRLWIPRYSLYTYPDVLVIEGSPIFQDLRPDTVTNPCLIFEVLSRSTQNYDRTSKFKYYRSIPAMQEYLLVDQYTVGIEHYIRLQDDSWRFRAYDSDTGSLRLATVSLDLALSHLYDGVNFEMQEPDDPIVEPS